MAVQSYWTGRSGAATKQKATGIQDAGSRSEVTGGQHLNAFRDALCELITGAGFSADEVRFRSGVELPGFYRPAKKWDIVVARKGRLCAAIEFKSQVGPSFGNNVNNRTEEAVGSSVDLWKAYERGVLGTHQPWLGYFFFLEDAAGSTRPVKVAEKIVFPPDSVFAKTSYADRYEILCRRMVLERNYTAACVLLSPRGTAGAYREREKELGFGHFARSLYGHLIGCTG